MTKNTSEKMTQQDEDFFLRKRNRELIANELCLCLLPIVRQYNFLPKRVLRESFSQVVNHLYHQTDDED
tara:strand:+ start:40 stop:246 length:207 start_codon:yes stop_codon:yes gene_type:complete